MRGLLARRAFRNLFDDEKQVRVVLKWLSDKGMLIFSQGANESLEAAIWKGKSSKWPDSNAYRSYEFRSPF